MKKIILIIIATTLSFAACKQQDIATDTPKCVESKIRDFDKNSPCNDAKVKEYTFQGMTVYVFGPGTCGADMTSEVIDNNCNSLGTLGGISGNTQINGENFSNAVYIKTTWQK